MNEVEFLQPREKVTAKNELFRLRAKESNILASRIFMGFATLVTPEDVEKGMSKLVSIPASSVLTNYQGGKQYEDLKKAAHFLVGKTLERKTPKGGFEVFALFSSIKYEDGVLTGRIDSALLPFFLTAKEQASLYTRLNFEQYVKLPSSYSQKLFAFLSSWKSNGTVEVSLDELHDLLQTPESFKKDFWQFRTYVLNKAHSDIHEHTSLRYEWEPVKKGRKMSHLRFIFDKKRRELVTKKQEKQKQADTHDREKKAFKICTACIKKKAYSCTEQTQAKYVCELCRTKFCREYFLKQAPLLDL